MTGWIVPWAVGALFLCGGFFAFVAGLGLLRFPDVFTRMHASTKAGTICPALILAGAALHFGAPGVAAKIVLAILFILLTAPIAAHMIGRAAQRTGVPMWTGTRLDRSGADLPQDEAGN